MIDRSSTDSDHGISGVCGPTSMNGSVSTMELGEGFLEKDGPELFFWGHFDVSVLVGTVICLWDEVIDEDGDRHTQGVHLD